MRELNAKQERLLSRLGHLTERIASGDATTREIERALALEVEIPWPHAHVGSLVKQSAFLSKAEASVRRLAKLRKQLSPRGAR